MDVDKFRTSFPEFASLSTYPNTMVTTWSTVAETLVRQCVWGDSWTLGVQLYTAHLLVLEAQNLKASKVGGSPGQQGGIANNKTVGSVTVGYDAQSTTEKDAGWYNLTNYGKQFIRLARIFGAGCIQL